MARIWVELIERGTAKTGNDFLKVSCLTEDHAKHQFYLWDACDLFEEAFNNGNRCFECMFGGDANFPKITSFETCPGDATEFYSFIYSSDDQALHLFNSLKNYVKDNAGFYSSLVDHVFNLPGPQGFQTVGDAFYLIPAAKAFHHDFRYGLLRHTHEVMSFVSRVCDSDLYKDHIDKEIAIVGALLHDVGKCFEYSFDGVSHAEYGTSLSVNQIYLASHLYKGAELITIAFYQMIQEDPALDSIENQMRVEHLKHIVLAHHLQREWAAVPKEPQTLEAYLVFLGDYFSAAFGKFVSIDWSNVSADNLFGATSKFNSFFGFTPFLKHMEPNEF